MKKLAEIISPLFSASIGCASLEKILNFTIRYYKILITLVKDSTLWRGKNVLSTPLKEMVTAVSELLSPNIHSYLGESEQNECKLKMFTISTNEKKGKSKMSMMTSKLDKITPDLIFQMEQFDVNVIKLSNRLKTDKSFLAKLVKRSNVRDFRLKLGSVKNN